MDMKKIAIFVNSLERGGAERVSVRLAEYFAAHGVSCSIITNFTGKNEYKVPDKVERFSLSGKKKIKNIFSLRKILKEQKPDAMLIMGTSDSIIGIPGTMGLKIRTIISERNDPTHYLGNKLVIGVSRFLMRFADDFVFQTNTAKSFYEKKLHNKGTVIFNPLITSEIPEAYHGERTRCFVTAGRLEPQKNQKMLIEAFSEIADKNPDFNLKIYGSGSLDDMLRKLITDLHMGNRIELCGNQPNILELIRDAYAFVLPSDFEGMPNALIEAMAVGLPCISTDCPCGGPGELIEEGVNGCLFSCGDKEMLKRIMQDVIDHPETAQKLGENAIAIKEKLDISNIGEQWIKILLPQYLQ